MEGFSIQFSVGQREMRSREQGLLRFLDPLCAQWKSLEHQLLLSRLAGSQADLTKCPHQSPRALGELPSPTSTNVLPQSALPVWPWAGHRVQHWGAAGALWDWGQRLPAHGQGEQSHILPLLLSSGLCVSCTPEVSLLGAKPVQIIKLPINLAAHLLVSRCVYMCCFLFI